MSIATQAMRNHQTKKPKTPQSEDRGVLDETKRLETDQGVGTVEIVLETRDTI